MRRGYTGCMKHEPAIFEQSDPDVEAQAIFRARADIAAGRTIAHAAVIDWLKTWGTPEDKPAPPEWFR